MSDISPHRSDDDQDERTAAPNQRHTRDDTPVRPPSSRSSSVKSEDSQATKISLHKDEHRPEVHRPAPPTPVSVRQSKYDNTDDITYDDIPLNVARIQTGPTTEESRTLTSQNSRGSHHSIEPGVPRIDLSDRDPTHMNDDVKVEFEDLFAEPDGYHSMDCVWTNSALVFTQTKFWCYRILTAIFAIPCAFCWGISFACLTCGFVWNVRPMLRRYAIEIIPYAKIWRIFIDACISPIFESCGRVFSGIYISLKKE